MPRYTVTHITTYAYQEPVAVSLNQVHLAPIDLPWQRVIGHQLTVSPEPTVFQRSRDYFGNPAATITVQTAHRELVVTAVSTIERAAPTIPDPMTTPPWEQVVASIRDGGPEVLAVAEFAYPSALVPVEPSFLAFARTTFRPERPILEALIELNRRINSEFTYDSNATDATTPVTDAFERRRGVCQDFALILIGCLRSLGIPARYISGYLETSPPPGRPRLVGADASHAWVQAWIGDQWVDLDPTNDCIPGERHLTLAIGRDFVDVSPMRGIILGGGSTSVRVSVDVLRL